MNIGGSRPNTRLETENVHAGASYVFSVTVGKRAHIIWEAARRRVTAGAMVANIRLQSRHLVDQRLVRLLSILVRYLDSILECGSTPLSRR